MTSCLYAHVPSADRPNVLISRDSMAPGRFYVRLLSQSLRYGLPAARRWGWIRTMVALSPWPTHALARTLSRWPARPRSDLDELLELTATSWTRLADATALPPLPSRLSALALQRSSALTVFVFGADSQPLLVLKVPAPGDARSEQEARILERAAPAALAPVYLGRVGDAYAQSVLAGEPLRLEPLSAKGARDLAWSPALEDLAIGLTRLASVTRANELPSGLEEAVQRCLEDPELSIEARSAVGDAWRVLEQTPASVLLHGDTSAQNCLFQGRKLSGLVDWELAGERGTPGFDSLNAWLAYLEHRIGLKRWSQGEVLAAFSHAWFDSPFGRAAHDAVAAAVAAGADANLVSQTEILFFARRLGRRLLRPDGYPTGSTTARAMLELVCARY